MTTLVIMAEPKFFEVRYEINPWMKIVNPVNKKLAWKQWQKLYQTYVNLGLKVKLIKPYPGLPDFSFTTDQAVIIGDNVVLARFRYPQRQLETKIVKDWYLKKGWKVYELPEGYFLEGGDVGFWNNTIFLGYGYRSLKKVKDFLNQISPYPVVALRLVDERFYHLDTCFFGLDNKTAFYYPLAFDDKSQKVLKERIPNLIPLNEREVVELAANSVRVGKVVVCQKGINSFAAKLKALGYITIELDMSEFKKAGGGIHCLSLMPLGSL